MAGSRPSPFSGSFSTFEQKCFQSQAWADVLLEVAERVIRELDQSCPAALLAAATRQHPLAQLELPARDREERRVLLLTLVLPPGHLSRIELRRPPQRHVRGRAEDLLEAAGPFLVELDHTLVIGHARRPSRAASRKLGDETCPAGIDALPRKQLLDLGRGHRVKEHALAARYDRWQHDERIEARRCEDDHAMRV